MKTLMTVLMILVLGSTAALAVHWPTIENIVVTPAADGSGLVTITYDCADDHDDLLLVVVEPRTTSARPGPSRSSRSAATSGRTSFPAPARRSSGTRPWIIPAWWPRR